MAIVRSRVNVDARLAGREKTVMCAMRIPAAKMAIADVHGNAIASKHSSIFLTVSSAHTHTRVSIPLNLVFSVFTDPATVECYATKVRLDETGGQDKC